MPTRIASKNYLGAIDVIILCGGQGTRLREVVKDRPKPMADINGRPFLDILIDYLAGFGFCRFILSIGYLAGMIEQYYKTKNMSPAVIFSKENKPLGTGGAIKNAEGHVRSNLFLVLNGDSFCPVDFNEFFNFHITKGALCSMAVVETENMAAGGGVILDEASKIIRFGEKQKQEKGLISAGIYFFEQRIFSFIPDRTRHSIEYDLFPQLVGQEFYGYPASRKMIDIGTPERYFIAQAIFKEQGRL